MIELEERYLAMVREIAAQHLPECEVRLYGSRFRGTPRRFSDIDLAVVADAPLPEPSLAAARAAFAESDLPYRVDLVDWNALSREFRSMIEKQGYHVIQSGGFRG